MTHTSTQQPKALRLADYLDDLFDADGEPKQAAAELRRQHVRIEELEDATDIAIERIAELEAQLSAIGAGGVEPLRKQAVVPQGWKLVLVGWQFYEDGKWWNGDDRIKDHRKNTEEARYPIRDVYAVEQQSAQPDAAPMVLPEPVAYYDGERWYANEESAICAYADMPKLQKVYTEQQVRDLLVDPSSQAGRTVMSDQELLELAAKAAGLTNLVCCPAWKCMAEFNIDKQGGYFKWDTYWNPLVRDSDALQLTVRLNLMLDTAYNGCTSVGSASLCEILEPHNGDPYAATRRAVVRAAAEIGKTMP